MLVLMLEEQEIHLLLVHLKVNPVVMELLVHLVMVQVVEEELAQQVLMELLRRVVQAVMV